MCKVNLKDMQREMGGKTRPYMFSLMGYFDARLKRQRIRAKKKFQPAYNRGFDDGLSVNQSNQKEGSR